MIFDVLSIIFKWVISTSLIASFAIAIILILKKCAGNKLNPNWHYCLWIIVVIRLMVPFTFSSSVSIFNYLNFNFLYPSSTNATEKTVGSTINEDNKNITQSTKDINNKQIKINKQTDNKQGLKSINNKKSLYVVNIANSNYSKLELNIFDIAAVVWIFSIAASLLYMLFIQYRFNKKIQKGFKVKCTYLINMSNDCKKVMGITKNIELVRTSHIKSPVLYGAIKPKILLPEGFDDLLDSNDLRYIFFHELSHYKRKDIVMNYICNIIQVVYFFNPVIWYGFYKMKNDREAACDNMALSFLGEETKIEYGKTILKLVKNYSEYNLVSGLAGIQSSKHIIKERVSRIKGFSESKLKLPIINIVVLIAAILFLFATVVNNVSESEVQANNSNKYQFKFGDSLCWMKPLKGNYTHVFSDKTIITMKYAYVDGGKFDIEFLEELNNKRMKNFRIYSTIKNSNHIIKPKSSSYYDISKELLYRPRGRVIQWNKIFAAPKSFEKNYIIVLTKKINNKIEKCKIKIPLYKTNINLYKSIKLNKVLKVKRGTITFKSIEVSQHTTIFKNRFEIDKKGKLDSTKRGFPYLEYSLNADKIICFARNYGSTASQWPTRDKNIFKYIDNSQFRSDINKPKNISINDIKILFDTYKNKIVKIPIPCNNKTINLCNSKILIKNGYKRGRNVYFDVNAVGLEDLVIYTCKDYSGGFCNGIDYQGFKPLQNGNLSGRFVASKFIKKNYIILKFEKRLKNVLASYPGQVNISIKKNQ